MHITDNTKYYSSLIIYEEIKFSTKNNNKFKVNFPSIEISDKKFTKAEAISSH